MTESNLICEVVRGAGCFLLAHDFRLGMTKPVAGELVGNSVSVGPRPRHRPRQLRDDRSITQMRVDAAGTNLMQAIDP